MLKGRGEERDRELGGDEECNRAKILLLRWSWGGIDMALLV